MVEGEGSTGLLSLRRASASVGLRGCRCPTVACAAAAGEGEAPCCPSGLLFSGVYPACHSYDPLGTDVCLPISLVQTLQLPKEARP